LINAFQGRVEVRKRPFDVIVLHIRLSRIDGFEVLRRLRAQHLTNRTLLLTARMAQWRTE
jgi:DNA-binding response OmpR family regulator